MRSKDGLRQVTLWGSLALFAIATAVATFLGSRGVDFRYSPGADGFWLAFIAAALLVVSRRPRATLAITNVALLVVTVILTIQKNVWSIERNYGLYGAENSVQFKNDDKRCQRAPLEYPLYRDNRFHQCFSYGEEQSVYHLAAFRLSVFRDEPRLSILPQSDAPVIIDMPNRWVSVYVRDYMLAGLEPKKIYSIASVPGEWPPYKDDSPFYRGEWSTDILPLPLTQNWTSPAAIVPELPALTADQPILWYLNTPETEAHIAVIERALNQLGFNRVSFRSQMSVIALQNLAYHALLEATQTNVDSQLRS